MPTHVKFGAVPLEAGRPAEAIAALDAMKLDTSDHFGSIDARILGPRRDLLRAHAVLNMERYREAVELLKPLVASGELEAAVLLYEAALNRTDLVTAEEALGAIANLGERDERWCTAHMRLAEARRQDPEGALYAIIRAHPHEVPAYWLLARRLLESGRSAAAVPHLQALSDLGMWEGAHNLGVLYAGFGRYRRALDCFRRADEIQPDRPETLANLEAAERALAAGLDSDGEDDDD